MRRRPHADETRQAVEPPPPPEGRAAPEDAGARARRPPAGPVRRRPDQRRLLTILASPVGLRQAFLLQEILGPPTALRGPDDRRRP